MKLKHYRQGETLYCLKGILHDWDQLNAEKILRALAASMKPGYSRLLIVENIIPETRVPVATAGLDMMVMLCCAALERTEKMWRELFEQAGLKLKQAWRRPDGDGLMEVVLP